MTKVNNNNNKNLGTEISFLNREDIQILFTFYIVLVFISSFMQFTKN